MPEFWMIQLLHGCIESIAIDVNNGLGEIPGELELGDVFISTAKIRCEINTFKLPLPSQDLVYLVGEVLVLVFFIVEEFGAFGGIVDNLGYLGIDVSNIEA